jgi:hypothetical protein
MRKSMRKPVQRKARLYYNKMNIYNGSEMSPPRPCWGGPSQF